MAFFKDFGAGVNSYSKAHQIIKKHKLWGYLIIPGIINLLFFLLLFINGWQISNRFTDWFFNYIGLDGNYEGWLKYLVITFYYLIKYIIRAIFVIIYLFTYRYIILAILSPVLAYLSEKTETLITGKKYNFNLKQLLKDSLRSLTMSLRNFIVEFFFILVFFVIGFIPIIGLISPIAMFILSCYYYGFSMMDFTNERHKMTAKESVWFIKDHKGFAIGHGFIFYMILMIPIWGIIFAPAYGVVSATIGIIELKSRKQQIYNS